MQDYMDGLRDTARDLERKHNALLTQVNARIAEISMTEQFSVRARELQSRLQAARDQAEQLKRQNLRFLEEIGDRIKREDRMEGLLRELMVCPRNWHPPWVDSVVLTMCVSVYLTRSRPRSASRTHRNTC